MRGLSSQGLVGTVNHGFQLVKNELVKDEFIPSLDSSGKNSPVIRGLLHFFSMKGHNFRGGSRNFPEEGNLVFKYIKH